METRTHAVAVKAYECVAAHANAPRKSRKEYRALAYSLPGMILQNGLAQATGFLLAKGKDEHRALLNDLNAVLQSSRASTAPDGEELHKSIIDSGLDQTMRLTRQSLEASGWIKRYAQGVLHDEPDRDGHDGDA